MASASISTVANCELSALGSEPGEIRSRQRTRRSSAMASAIADDHVRAAIAHMTSEEAWEAMRPLTKLGRDLAALHATIDVDDIPVLGIKAGRYDVQRFIYWNFAKLFWNENYPFEANLHVNFD